MPKPHKGEKKKDFISRCIPILIDEGKEKDQAVAICYSFWERKNEDTELIIDKVLNEAKEDVVMFFDPNLERENTKDKPRKNTLVVGKIIDNKLQVIDGEVWVGGHILDEVIPEVADVVKKWNPKKVFVEDNFFQKFLKDYMKEFNIPFVGITRNVSREAVEMTGNGNDIEWKIKKDKDLLFGAGSLFSTIKKITESTVVADVEQNLTQNKLFTQKRKKSKKCKKFKEELMKDDA